uniref:25S rRNA (uridine-N(3))-methyltransferase BMT5-like domain-containing protein n=1 Tax=Nymphaea colorata TaxID=210225 RepID=A0A5K1FYG6_9MAGN
MVSRKVCRKLESADALLERIEFLGCDEVSRIYFPDEDPLNRVVTKGLKKGYIVNYSEWEEILLVGEGDFSFSLGLARALGDGTNMIATSLDRPGTNLSLLLSLLSIPLWQMNTSAWLPQ